ncbi:hypothetical protein IE53DRAFT_370673 [Violaceomyces palustris]|uniref:Uncharacterized protein n=1 Tax=Violaceomyces palustris TaxID=1673888 RepID=A0ACD0NRD5_9BASI|nr:hypothetical protein IE53DRAFT_370673 [Violaceomyces palustris]
MSSAVPSTTSYGPSTSATGSLLLSEPPASSGFSSSFAGGSYRTRTETAPYNYDEQAPRSQQMHHPFPTAEGSEGALGTQGIPYGAQHSFVDQQRSLPVSQESFVPSHTRHQSLGHTGPMGFGGPSSYPASHLGSSYAPYTPSRSGESSHSGHELSSPVSRPSSMATSPNRQRFKNTPYSDPRQGLRGPRPVGAGVGPASNGFSGSSPAMKVEQVFPESDSPRSFKRSGEHMDTQRSPPEHNALLRRPASFPVLGSGNHPGVGHNTPGRNHSMLPGNPSFYDEEDGRRSSFGGSSSFGGPSSFGSVTTVMPGGPMPHRDDGASYPQSIPQLMRASQIAGPPGMPNDPNYSPPSLANTQRAKLELHGNLNDMAIGWSHDEWRGGRRLVQFWRRQEGATIHTTFRPILPSQYVPNSIVVSCIFREDKNECYVTSVDTIYLLEALVASRFTVEEKNRIRRNLEGFRPMTVSKNKRDCERFFKLIMSFPNPKPRNIEKDVKVFPWKILASALSKIISKYSATYEGAIYPEPVVDLGAAPGGTAGALPGVDLAGGNYRDESGGDYQPSSSPGYRDARLAASHDFNRQSQGGYPRGYGGPSSLPHQQHHSQQHEGYVHGQAGLDGNSHGVRRKTSGGQFDFGDFMSPGATSSGSQGMNGIAGGASNGGYSSSSHEHGPSSGNPGYVSAPPTYDSFNTEGGPMYSSSASSSDVGRQQHQHQRSMSGSTLAAATGYYQDERRP